MVSRLIGSGFSLLFLFAAAAASGYLAERSWHSVTSYQTPYAFRERLPQGEPLTQRVVLVVVDGIRLDVSKNMGNLQRLARRGVSSVVEAAVPSLSNPNRAVMVTGAWPEVNGVTNNATYQPPPVDSLFSLAREAELPVAAAGSAFWRRAFGMYLDGRLLELPKEPSQPASVPELVHWQEKTCSEIIQFLTQYPTGLLVAGLTGADEAGHEFGGASHSYRDVARVVDGCLANLVAAFDNGETTFVVVSDHGHTDRRGRGGHGGTEEEVLRVPIVLAGKAIVPGVQWQAEMVDVAPTIAALLGLPFPATNQGEVAWEALDMAGHERQAMRARWEQQQRLVAARIPAREQVLAQQKQTRVFPAFLAALVTVGCMALVLWQQRGRSGRLLLALAAYYGCYYGLFALLGLGYSLSSISREEYLYSFLGSDLLAAAIALVAACLLVRRPTDEDASIALDVSLLIACTVALQVVIIYYRYGLMMEGFLPPLGASFKAYLDLLQIVAIAPTCAVIFGVFRAVQRRSAGAGVRPDPVA
jgi:Type I phosphodiesterase / nucleotide pyrophosphatase